MAYTWCMYIVIKLLSHNFKAEDSSASKQMF